MEALPLMHHVVSLTMSTTNSGGYNIDGDPPICSEDDFEALQRCRRGDIH